MLARDMSPSLGRRSQLPRPLKPTSPTSSSPASPTRSSTTTPTMQRPPLSPPQSFTATRLPSPPLSPTPLPTTPTPPRRLRWECPDPTLHSGPSSPRLRHEPSTDSITANERFSPVQWALSPPGSPPPLSLYTNVALLHYHIHQSPVPSPPCEMANSMTLESVAEGAVVQKSDVVPSSEAETETAIHPTSAESVVRESKAVKSTKSLEEFIAVEEALTKSPYIVPMDVVTTTRLEKKVRIVERMADIDEVVVNGDVKVESIVVVKAESESEQLDGERDTVAELVEEYAKPEEAEVSQSEISPESSPFIEFPDKREHPVEHDETPPSPSPFRPQESPSESLMELISPLELPAVPAIDEILSETTKSDADEKPQSTKEPPKSIETALDIEEYPADPIQTDEELAPSDNAVSLRVPTDPTTPLRTNETTVKRMPSIQRRGQEYLSQYLEKRRTSSKSHTRRPSIQIIEPPKPAPSPKRKESPSFTTLIVWMIIFWSLAANVILMVKLMNLESSAENDVGEWQTPAWTRSDGHGAVPAKQDRVHVQSGKIEFATLQIRQRPAQTDDEGEEEFEFRPWVNGIVKAVWWRIYDIVINRNL